MAQGRAKLSRKLILCGLLALTGCSLFGHTKSEITPQNKEPPATRQNNQAIDQCEKLYPDPRRKPALLRIKCFNEATLAYYAAFAGNPWSPTVRVLAAQLVEVAEKYDSGQISEAEFDFEKEQAIANFTAQVTQRSAAKVNAPSTQTGAASSQLVATLLPKQMTCVPTSNGVSCY
jgi:hypothetical protein